jgi:hypothetical protein
MPSVLTRYEWKEKESDLSIQTLGYAVLFTSEATSNFLSTSFCVAFSIQRNQSDPEALIPAADIVRYSFQRASLPNWETDSSVLSSFVHEFFDWGQRYFINLLAGSISWFFGLALWFTSLNWVRRKYFEVRILDHIDCREGSSSVEQSPSVYTSFICHSFASRRRNDE